MRRRLFLAGVIALPAIARAAGTPRRILVLGDSLALGTGASRADGGFIFPAFRRLLPTQPGTLLDNVAIGGSTVADVLRVQVGRVAEFAPDVVIVCVGGNDVVRRTPSAAFARDYVAVLRAMRRSAPRARVICCGVPDVAISPIFADERSAVAALSAADDRAARAAALDAGARFIDFFRLTQRAGTNDERFFSRDRFHPSDAGYALLTDALWPALRNAIATAQPSR